MLMYAAIVLLLPFTLTLSVYAEFREFQMTNERICGNVSSLIDHNCTVPLGRSRSDLDCGIRCSQHDDCVGSLLDEENMCHSLIICRYACTKMKCKEEVYITVSRKSCHNGGKFTRKESCQCKCKYGWVGQYCETMAKNCSQLTKHAGYITTGKVQPVTINWNSRKRKIGCAQNSGDSTVHYFLWQNNGKYNRSLSWTDYRDGYFLDNDNNWLGLQMAHELTTMYPVNYIRIVAFFEDRNPVTNKQLWYTFSTQHYYNFSVKNESQGYAFTMDSYEIQVFPFLGGEYLPITDVLSDSQNIPFSTWDRDNDFDPNHNCARLASSGWWFKTCSSTSSSLEPASFLDLNMLGMNTMTLPRPRQPAHLSIPGYDFTDSSYATYFKYIAARLKVPLE